MANLNLQEARSLASQLWSLYGKCISKIRCKTCFERWKNNGSIEKEKPPMWPPSYKGQHCPICGNELPSASVPF